MRSKFPQTILIGILFVFPAAMVAWPAAARTITVERDGSGDFATLQPALDVAAAGDTVLIGPGEFPEMTLQYLPNAGGWFEVAGCIRVPNVTLIGFGETSTQVGPPIYTGDVNIGIAFPVAGELRVEALTLRNVNVGIHDDYGRLFVENCTIKGAVTGIQWYSTESGGGVWNSHFESDILYSTGILLLGTGTDVQMRVSHS